MPTNDSSFGKIIVIEWLSSEKGSNLIAHKSVLNKYSTR